MASHLRDAAALRLLIVSLTLPAVAFGQAETAVSSRYGWSAVAAGEGAFPMDSQPRILPGMIDLPTFDRSCDGAGPVIGPPMAGGVGSKLTLEVSVTACAPAAQEPPAGVTCGWRISPLRQEVPSRYWDRSCHCYPGNPGTADTTCSKIRTVTSSAPVSWTGPSGHIELDLPPYTGIYRLFLSCQADGEAMPVLRGDLFVTWDEPMIWVRPPRVEWYHHAACWGEGFESAAAESEILATMLDGLYRYGELNWRYGYAVKNEEKTGEYDFPVGYRPHEGYSFIRYNLWAYEPLHCFGGTDNHGKKVRFCKCPWQGLTAMPPICNFSDCWIFADTFTGITATMGIGGLRKYKLVGKYNQGFMTSPAAVSLDPEFRGNVVCHDDLDTCYPYDFGNHLLRQRDDTWYDPTFGGLYGNPDDAVGANALSVEDLADGGYAVSYGGMEHVFTVNGYGNQPIFRIKPSGPDPAASRLDEVRIQSVELSASSSEGVSDSLLAKLKVEVTGEGSYTVFGSLWSGETLVTDQVSVFAATRPAAYLAPETTEATLTFSGDEIRRSGIDGPYTAELTVFADEAALGTRRFDGGSDLVASQFGENGAEIALGGPGGTLPPEILVPAWAEAAAAAIDPDGDGRVDELAYGIPLLVWKGAEYAVEVRLAIDGTTIAYAGWKGTLEPSTGTQTVAVRIDGTRIAGERLTGEYDLTVLLFDDKLREISGWQGSIGRYRADGFE